MKNYYEILNIDNTATKDNIYNAYYNKISQFNNLPFHTPRMISEIKSIKEALYVLGDNNKKEKYDKKCIKMLQYKEEGKYKDNTKICDRLFSINFN